MGAPNHPYHTRARTRHMEQAIDELEQQSMQTRAENSLTRCSSSSPGTPPCPLPLLPEAASNAATQGTPVYPPSFSPQYGMPLGWNAPTEAQVVEEPEAVEASCPIPQATQATVSLPHYSYPPGPPGQTGATFRNLEATPVHDEKISSLEQQVRIIEGTGGHDLDATDLYLMSNVALQVDFKTPEFKKYKGSSCPRVHLAMYCRKMVAYIHQDKILVHCFQDSLTGAALNWSRLQNLSKMESEGFKDYAQRWRELAA
ncbi:hypothetical protein CR513_01046, partial [Mucuna pruriens]